MSRIPAVVGSVCVVFLLACMGGDAGPGSMPGPTPVDKDGVVKDPVDEKSEGDADGDEGDPEDGENGEDGEGDDGAAWCCEYDGPLGATQSLIDNPKECTETFEDVNPRFVQGAQCEPVCCKYPKDVADLAEGYNYETVASGNCTARQGAEVDKEEVGSDARACLGENGKATSAPQPTTTVAPRGPGKVVRPGGRGNRGGGSTAPRPSGGGGGRVVRPR